jgi:hypothetical protein
MKIIKVEPLLLDRFCYVRIETYQGITDLGSHLRHFTGWQSHWSSPGATR